MGHVKTIDGYDVKVPSQGQVNYNTVAGSIGLASAVLGNGFLGGLFGGNRNCQPQCVNSDDECVNRYELRMEKELAAKDSEIALLKSNIYQDQKSLELYRYVDGKFAAIEATLAGQAVRNQGFTDAFRELQKDIDYKVNLEAERRECADCKIVNYANSTFATKLITDYTAGTTSAAAETYNPLACGCGCK
jgi:hypothetical protein